MFDDHETRARMVVEERCAMLEEEIDKLIAQGILEECYDEDGTRYIRRTDESQDRV